MIFQLKHCTCYFYFHSFLKSPIKLDIPAENAYLLNLQNAISNLVILHLHINWIGNIQITCKCIKIELKVQFKSKLSSYL